MPIRYLLALIICTSIFFFVACQNAPRQAMLPRQTGTLADSAMVVSAHRLASKAGLEVLKNGGNAIDAAIAVQFALAVVYPEAGNLGGGGFLVCRLASGEAAALDFREQAPEAAHRDMYLDKLGKPIDKRSTMGHLAVGVPGTVAGAVEAHKKYGKSSWASLLQPAINLAEGGIVFETDVEPQKLNNEQVAFRQYNTRPCRFDKKTPWKMGDTLRQPELAQTLRRVRDKGAAGFYEGATADSIVQEMKRGNGILTHQDLLHYKAIWRKPLTGNYKEYGLITMPPPSSGGVLLLQLLGMIDNKPFKENGFQHPKTVHYIAEAERLAYADRATHLGDPDFYPVPLEPLLKPSYIEQRAAKIDLQQATRSCNITAGVFAKEGEQTTHLSIIDQWGNAVAVTTTLNDSFGSRVVVGGAGFLLNNQMDDFSAKPGTPNLYGLVGSDANAIVPHKRMLSSMCPTIVTQNGNLFMVLGTPGGSTIITSVLQTFLNVSEYGFTMQEAVNAPRFHCQWLPDTLFVEHDALNANTRETLQKMGHFVVERKPIGRVDAILVRSDQKLEGGADRRGEDTALGW